MEEKEAGVVTPARDSRRDHRWLEMRDARVSRSGSVGWGCEGETVENLDTISGATSDERRATNDERRATSDVREHEGGEWQRS
jgi:hypothetical protein